MKSIKKLILGLMFATSSYCWAGSSAGLVSSILVHTPNLLMFKIGTISGTPACNATQEWAISMDKLEAKPMLAILLSAQAQGKQVYVHGYTNTCADWGDRELPSYIVLIN